MVKLARGGMNNSNRGRSKPRPLFPPGELPLFGPPPAYMRRPGPPIPPPARGPIGYDYGPPPPPPPPPMRLPPHLGPPMPPPPHMPLRGRPGRPPPPMPLLQAPVMPPRPLPFIRGRGMGPRMGPGKKLGKGIKKAKNRRHKKGAPTTSQNKPEGDYYCEICDRSWMTPEELEVHVSEHISCHFEGCSFRAAPKIVSLHVKLQHDSGIFDKIVKSTNKEDIEKWREERKRNFPTRENIEKKMAERKEMEERGERIEQNMKSFRRNQRIYSDVKGKSQDTNFSHKRKRNKFKKINNNMDNNVKGVNPQFLSTASLPDDIGETKNDEDYNISDEEWISDNKGVPESAPISNVLMNLSSNYASDDEETDSQQIVPCNKESEIVKGLEDRCGGSDDEPPEEAKIVRQNDGLLNDETLPLEPSKITDKFSKRKRLHPKHQIKPKPKVMKWEASLRKRPLTLLEKLLTKEIKQERNYILQCIRFIITENYFDTSIN